MTVASDEELEILNEPSCSSWLKEQIIVTRYRDPVDALRDAEILVATLSQRLERTTV